MPPERPIGVDLSNTWVTDADLAKVARLPQLQSINLAYTRITDQGLEHLAPLKDVKALNLHYAESVTDQGIAHLKHWKNLEHLDLRGTKVTSTLFEHIARMTQPPVPGCRLQPGQRRLLRAPGEPRSPRTSRLRRKQDERCGPAVAEVVARAQGVERLRPPEDRLRPLERRRDGLQHRPHRATLADWKSSTWARPTSRIGASPSWRT